MGSIRSWLSQWSLDDSRGNGLACAARIAALLLGIENSADDAVPQPHARLLFDAGGVRDKTMQAIKGATHYYAGQPEFLAEATNLIRNSLAERRILPC